MPTLGMEVGVAIIGGEMEDRPTVREMVSKTGQTSEQLTNDGDVGKGQLPHIPRYVWYGLKKLEKV